jgi:hypothetical protein
MFLPRVCLFCVIFNSTKVRQLRHNALQVLFGVAVNYKDGIKVLLRTEELVIRATSMMLLGELEDLNILNPDPLRYDR